ncbi:MAG: AAA family ATPase [Deltaproteobacteria bacterium]|nr:AAA family ATPase [Deltaproteobacteria bacterium]
MGETLSVAKLREKHDSLVERFSLLQDNYELTNRQRELAGAWRNLLEAAGQLVDAELSVAFVAQVGRGKSALVAAATNLRLEKGATPAEWSVLPVGAGRTTLGETRIHFENRSDVRLKVDPISEPDLRDELRFFAQDLWALAHETKAASVGEGAGEELHELLREWLLPNADDAREQLRELANRASDAAQLEETLLTRLDLAQRVRPLESAFEATPEGFAQIKEQLRELMEGRHREGPAPHVVSLWLPQGSAGAAIARVIDTRGLEADASGVLINARRDISSLVEDPSTLLVVCTEFEAAPDSVSLGLLQYIKDLGVHHGFDERSPRLVIVDRRGKPQEKKEQTRWARLRKKRVDQCNDQIYRSELQHLLPPEHVSAIDVQCEPENISALLAEMAAEAAEKRSKAWAQYLFQAEEAIASLSKAEYEAMTTEQDLRIWWAWDAGLAEADSFSRHPEQFSNGLDVLADAIENRPELIKHVSHVRAAARRRGQYRYLNMVDLGAKLAASVGAFPYLRALGKILEVDDIKAGAGGSSEAGDYLEMQKKLFANAVSRYFKELETRWREILAEHFSSELSNQLWSDCQRRWGRGQGYLHDVALFFRRESKKTKLGLTAEHRPRPLAEKLPSRPTLFSLRNAKLENYRGIEKKHIPIGDITMLVGNNGMGKTCWLEAIAASIGALLPGMGAGPAPRFLDSDIRQVVRELGGIPDLQHQLPMVLTAEAELDGHPLTWARRVEALGADVTEDHALKHLATQMGESVRAHSLRQLPVLAYYGTQRLWPVELNAAESPERLDSRLDGYRDCLKAASTHEHMQNWVRHYTLVALQEKAPVPQLDAIERAVVSCIEGAERFQYSLKRKELTLTMQDGRLLLFRMLSDGYRNIVAMVADIAWRASVLNPQLRARAPELAEGVVLIDEIDLHLHPKWQRHVMLDLRRAFPKLQFVATTHSPFIVQSLQPGQLVNLDPGIEAATYADKSPEDIAEEIMGVDLPQRSWRRRKEAEVAEAYYHLLEQIPKADKAELASLKQQLNVLLEPYAENQAFTAYLQRKRRLAELGPSSTDEIGPS